MPSAPGRTATPKSVTPTTSGPGRRQRYASVPIPSTSPSWVRCGSRTPDQQQRLRVTNQPNLSDLNLYDSLLDGSPSTLDAADVTLVRNGSQNGGQHRLGADTNTLSFVKTGGVRPGQLCGDPVQRHWLMANLLDGDGDFNDNEVGDNYTANFSVATPAVDTRIVPPRLLARPRPGRRPGHRADSADQDRHRDERQGVDVDVLYNRRS
jgi:hypothetical protein